MDWSVLTYDDRNKRINGADDELQLIPWRWRVSSAYASMPMKTKLGVYVNKDYGNIVDRRSMKLRDLWSKFCSKAVRIRSAGEYTKKYYFLMVEMKQLERRAVILGLDRIIQKDRYPDNKKMKNNLKQSEFM